MKRVNTAAEMDPKKPLLRIYVFAAPYKLERANGVTELDLV
jgi:hypothetical protein